MAKIKYGRTETIQTESGTTRQVWALYERDASEEQPTFEGKQPIAYFSNSATARQFDNLQELTGRLERFVELMAQNLGCDATEEQVVRATDTFIQNNVRLQYLNNALERQRSDLARQAESLIQDLQGYLRAATQRPVVIQTEVAPNEQPATV
jgi:hypothetical protein